MRLNISPLVAISLALGSSAKDLSQPATQPKHHDKVAAACATIPSPFPAWSQLPEQTTMPDPFLPLGYTTTSNAGNTSASAFAQAVMNGKANGRIQSTDEWYNCRQPEILKMLQEYQYGYYPDHSQETVTATRAGNTVSISVSAASAAGKTGKFSASVQLPSGASATKPVPVVINIGGMDNQPYLAAGIAIVGFDYTAVAADSNSKTGAFWSLYTGRDIGEHHLPPPPHFQDPVSRGPQIADSPSRRPHSLGLGIPPRPRRPQPHRPGNRPHPRRCYRLLPSRQRRPRRGALRHAHHTHHAHVQRRPRAGPVSVSQHERAGRNPGELQGRRAVVERQCAGHVRQSLGEFAV